MTEKRFTSKVVNWWHNVDEVRVVFDNGEWIDADDCAKLLDALYQENQQLKKENEQLEKNWKRCKAWLNSDKYDYELTLAFIKNKGYSLKDVLEYEKELKL